MAERTCRKNRKSGETGIELEINLDGAGQSRVATGFGLLNHMLELTAFWGAFDLALTCRGDLDVDAHHTVEDCGLVLGAAVLEALGGRRGIARVGFARVPMDEALCEVTLDLSGRPWLVWRGGELLPPVIAGEEKDLWREFYKAFATSCRCNLHIDILYGKNGHHMLESAAKGFGLALARAWAVVDSRIKSTKGVLDQ